jgi:exonuclease VII large subunit
MSVGAQLPVASEEEQSLESLLQDAQQRLFALRKQKAEKTDAANRAAQLDCLKEQLAVSEQELQTFEQTTIPAALATLDEQIQARYEKCHGRTGLYSQPDVSNPVNLAANRIVQLKDNLHQRKRQLEELRARVAGLQSQVDGDIARAKNAEGQP